MTANITNSTVNQTKGASNISNGTEGKEQLNEGINIKKTQQFINLKNTLNKTSVTKADPNIKKAVWSVDLSSPVGFTLPAQIDPKFSYL